MLQGSACLYWRGSGPPAARKAARRLPCSSVAAAVDAHALPTAASSLRSAQRCGTSALSQTARQIEMLLNRGEGASLCFRWKQEPHRDKLRVKVIVAGGKCAHLVSPVSLLASAQPREARRGCLRGRAAGLALSVPWLRLPLLGLGPAHPLSSGKPRALPAGGDALGHSGPYSARPPLSLTPRCPQLPTRAARS